MSKQNVPFVPKGNVEVLYAVGSEDIRYLEGRMLTVVDASIGDQEQRKALKDIVRQNIWSWCENVPRRVLSDDARYIAEMPSILEGRAVVGSNTRRS